MYRYDIHMCTPNYIAPSHAGSPSIQRINKPRENLGMRLTLNFSSPQRFYDVVFPSIGVPLSDHYGVKVRLSNIRLNCNAIQECRYHCVSEIKPLPPLQVDFSEVCFD